MSWMVMYASEMQDKIVHVKDRAFNDQRYFICDQKLAGKVSLC